MKQYENQYLEKYYSSIKELPLENWICLHDKSDPTQLSRTGKICKLVNKAYERVESSFIDEFGTGKEFLELQEKRIELELMKCQQIHTRDLSNQIFIDLLEDEIELIESKKTKGDKIRKMIPWVESEMGLRINTKETSTFDFYYMVNFILEKNRK